MHTCRPIARWGQRPVDRADNWTPEWEGFLCRENRLRTRLQQLSLPLSLGPWPLPHPPSEGKAPGPGSTDLRQTFHGFLELHRLLVMGTEELDGIGQSHGEIWVHRGIMGLVWSCPWKAPPSHLPPDYPVMPNSGGWLEEEEVEWTTYLPRCQVHSPSTPGRQKGRAW